METWNLLSFHPRENISEAIISKLEQKKPQWNCECNLCEEKDMFANQTVNKCSKLKQKKYKTHTWGDVLADWELCNWHGFDYTNKNYH